MQLLAHNIMRGKIFCTSYVVCPAPASVVNFTLTERNESETNPRLFFTENDNTDLVGEGQFNFIASATSSLSIIRIFYTVSLEGVLQTMAMELVFTFFVA